jgi:hypothetical protein
MSQPDHVPVDCGRYYVAAQTAEVGLSDEQSAAILSTPDSQFGDEDSDYAPEVRQTDVHSSTMDQILDYYDQHQPYNDITILKPQEDE